MTILETERLTLRRLCEADATFILKLLNEPSFLQYIGDKGVRTLDDARSYILAGPMEMYARLGFGLYLVQAKADGRSMGICGLIKRDTLPGVDIGFAFLPEFWGKGYAYEAAAAALNYGRDTLGFKRIVAITSPDNAASGRLLEKLGLRFERMIRLSEGAAEIRLFGSDG
ncbi:MAG TPA: GNAT family N-acetyltransferase [Blastocatellia bacterium]|nr:GNAT family N-acetyltransferase [Blastocatellia bacterium]HMY72525.1 GNAT family N-acetyltransferase [Blastocatellia bacterium]HMZ16570.1 GNAT family N-acetyltransferase [Blastocatellia bacterium]HNG31652.1 GNAT family N-acetyltransferase [Blastocatellia bacterium]